MCSSIIVSPRYLRAPGHTPNAFMGGVVVREGFLEEGTSLDLGSGLLALTAVWIMECWRESREMLEVIHMGIMVSNENILEILDSW